jgi:hypothetical protein
MVEKDGRLIFLFVEQKRGGGPEAGIAIENHLISAKDDIETISGPPAIREISERFDHKLADRIESIRFGQSPGKHRCPLPIGQRRDDQRFEWRRSAIGRSGKKVII